MENESFTVLLKMSFEQRIIQLKYTYNYLSPQKLLIGKLCYEWNMSWNEKRIPLNIICVTYLTCSAKQTFADCQFEPTIQ